MTSYTKADFPIGTRVRIVDFEFEGDSPQNGKTGTVVEWDAPQSGSTQYVCVNRDGSRFGDSDKFPVRPKEIEPIVEPGVDFKPGDLVRVKDNVTLEGGKHNGQRGTVTRIGPFFTYVAVSTSPNPVPFNEDEIEHVDAPAPSTADDLNARADDAQKALDEANAQIKALYGQAHELEEQAYALDQQVHVFRTAATFLADKESDK